MNIYRYPPAFGFESESCRYMGEQLLKDAHTQNSYEISQGRIFQPFDVQKFVDNYKSNEKDLYKQRNVVKILEWVPLIGTIIGIARILNAIPKLDIGMFMRGVVSSTSLGFILIPIDLFYTLIDHPSLV